MKEEAASQDEVRLSATLATDGEYLRRTCGSCGLDFKSYSSPDQFRHSLEATVRKVAVEYGVSEYESDDAEEDLLFCPYCGFQAAAEEMHTAETAAYVRRLAFREIVFPMMADVFSNLEFKSEFVSITSTGPGVKPPIPVHGPEAPDLDEVDFLCCGKGAKLLRGWLQEVHCPYCGGEAIVV